MMKKDKNNQNTNSIPKYLLGNYFKKPIKWLAHLINNYGNSKHPFITTGTSYAYAVVDEKRRHPELTELQIHEIVNSRIKQNYKKLGLPTNNTTPSLAAAGLALGSLYCPWLAVPDIIYDTAASIDEPSTSNNIHTIADFPETVAKFTPSKIDDYVAKGVLILGNIDDAISTSGRNMFSNFDKKPGKLNNTTDKTSVRESTNIKYRKNGGAIRKMQTAAGGPIKLYSTQWADDWKKRLDSPVLKARQLLEQTNKTPVKYIGGNKDAARKEFWNQEPVFQHAVDSIADRYGISPESLKYRLDKEGFTDYNIKRRNARVQKGHQQFEPRGYQLLNNSMYKLAGTQIGLDDAKTYIDSGNVKLINEKWFDLGTFKNEKGRITYPVEPATLNDGMGIVAAHLKYFKDQAHKDFPNASEYDLNRYSNAYYNRGAYGGKKWVLAGAKGYNYRKQGGMLELLKNGGQIRKMLTAAGGPLNLSPEDIKRGANLIGEYFLKGLGAFGKIATAPFRSQGPTSATIYKSKELLAKERTIENKSEEQLGKAMTWVSPLNYGAALVTGNGLNAKKGGEEIEKLEPWQQALLRGTELYVGPKAVKGVGKGVKAAPKAVVNTAAKAGVKPAKAAVIAREINRTTKLGVQNINLRPKILNYDLLANNYGFPKSFKLLGVESEQRAFLGEDGYVYKIPKYGASDGTFVTKNMSINHLPNDLGAKTEFLGMRKNPDGTKTPIIRLEYVNPIESRQLYLDLIKNYNYNDEFHFILFDDKGLHVVDDIRPSNVGTINGKLKIFDIGTYETPKSIQKPVIKTTKQEPLTSLKFFERKPFNSKLKKSEEAGVPKGERFKNKKHYTGIGRNYRGTLFGEENIPKDIEYVEPITSGKKFGESDYSFENRKYATKQYLKELNNRDSGIFSDKGVESIKKYISLLPDDLNSNFINTNGLLSFYIRDFRLYLNDLGYRAGDLTDTEIAKLLTNLYDILSKTLTGKLKGKVVFHSGPNFFDLFDFAHTGETMGNMGYLGPGNYFSTKPSVYGGKGNYTTQDLIGQYRYPRRLPYLINNIKSTPVSGELKKAKIIPEYTSPPRETYGDASAKNNYILLVILPLVKSTKVRDMAVLDDISVSPHSLYTNGVQTEFMVPRNTGIKSLYPHPSLFIEDANGKITLNRNWDDIRVNYKQGGKMNILEFLKNGSGIHIKEKNKGKFTSYCGGKVTDECILKGKNSSNPAIRKRATFADNARHFKHCLGGNIKKHLEGAKLTFGLKLGNFANSDLGKSVISNGLSFLSDKLFNKSASSNLEIALAAQEKELPTINPMQIAQMIEIARNQYADPENPNANGGDIFNSYIKNQITAPILAKQLEEYKKRLAAIDLLKNQAKSSAVGTFFNTLAQGGIEYLLNKYGTTEKADRN